MKFTIALAVIVGCHRPIDRGPDLQIVGETLRLRPGDPVPRSSPWFDGKAVHLTGARGEVLGIQVLHRQSGAAKLAIPKTEVHGFAVKRVHVSRPSTAMYGGDSRGTGDYPDELIANDAPETDPAYFTITIPKDLAPSTYTGELAVGVQKFPVTLDVVPVTLELPMASWAEYHPDSLGGTMEQPSAAELACSRMFREHGMLLAPPMDAVSFRARQEQVRGAPYVPVNLGTDPVKAAGEARAWKGLAPGQKPFAIPIDEPKQAQREQVRRLADAVHEANRDMIYAVTDEPRDEYGDSIDLYIPQTPKLTDQYLRWTYNGKPPGAGSMTVDAPAPGPRTWGWIMWRYKIAIWYVWDALYWTDRYNHKKEPPHVLDAAKDAVSFDDGDDHGNLDGVLALPGCHPTLRLEAMRRGMQDRVLLDLASTCDLNATLDLAKQMIPRALGDASGSPAWPSDEAPWEAARRRLLELASCSK